MEKQFRQCHRSYGYVFCTCKPGRCESEIKLRKQTKREKITKKFWSLIDKLQKIVS